MYVGKRFQRGANDWCVRADADPKGQAEWYEDMFTACSKRDWVGGMALWSWDAKLYQERSAKDPYGL